MNLSEIIELIGKVPVDTNSCSITEEDVAKYIKNNYVITEYEANTIGHHIIRCLKDLAYISNIKLVLK